MSSKMPPGVKWERVKELAHAETELRRQLSAAQAENRVRQENFEAMQVENQGLRNTARLLAAALTALEFDMLRDDVGALCHVLRQHPEDDFNLLDLQEHARDYLAASQA